MQHIVDKTYATFWQRLLAHNIDLLLLLFIFYLVSLIPFDGYDSILFFTIYVAYHTAFECTGWQGSPGKRWLKIQVVNDQESRNNFLVFSLRNALKILSLLSLFLGFAMINFNKRAKGLHDWIAGSSVYQQDGIGKK